VRGGDVPGRERVPHVHARVPGFSGRRVDARIGVVEMDLVEKRVRRGCDLTVVPASGGAVNRERPEMFRSESRRVRYWRRYGLGCHPIPIRTRSSCQEISCVSPDCMCFSVHGFSPFLDLLIAFPSGEMGATHTNLARAYGCPPSRSGYCARNRNAGQDHALRRITLSAGSRYMQ
jgi:hypothetical protein